MSSIRLSVANSETARRTRDLYSPVKQVSMSNSEKRASNNPDSKKARSNIRLEKRLNEFKRISDDG